jgi:hypothetical protein
MLALRSPHAFALVWLAAGAAACVPRGDPPAGAQLVADRTTTLAGIAPPNGDGVTRVLVTRPAAGQPLPDPNNAQSGLPSVDLFVVSADAAGAGPPERLLAASIVPSPGAVGGCTPGLAVCFPSDGRGRAFVTIGYDPATGFPIVARLDPVTGGRLDLGVAPYFILSPSTRRMVVFSDVRAAQAALYEADDTEVPLGETMFALFIGEDLYQLTAANELVRIVPGGAPEILATGISFFNQATTQGDVLLQLTRPTADPLVQAESFFDTVTLEETPSPFPSDMLITLSPEGRWFMAFDYSANTVTFLERATGAEEVFAPPDFTLGSTSWAWRAGHDEVWFESDYPQPEVWIKKLGGPTVAFQALAWAYSGDGGRTGSFLTADGASWFSSRAPFSAQPILQVGSADDPMGPRFDIAPAGTTSSSYWPLADGRILVPAHLRDANRNDLYAVDPKTGDTRVLGEQGFVMVVGQTRVLASLHVNDGRGSLTAVELATGRASALAPEFTMSAVVEPTGADAMAPGAHVAYQFQARFESPYDGIWLATVP